MEMKKWIKPEMLIVTRHKPEENVLTTYKRNQQGLSGPYGNRCRNAGVYCDTSHTS